MSAHLTHEELTHAMSGASSSAVDAHLLICPRCAHELDQVKNSIAAFRGAALAWSESSGAADRAATVLGTLPKRPGRAGLWILAAATVLLAGGLTFYLRDHRIAHQAVSAQVAHPVTASQPLRSQVQKDNELLSQVNSELAEAVPAPMQPLRLLESGASGTSTNK